MCVKCKRKEQELDEKYPGFLKGLEELKAFQTEKHAMGKRKKK